MNVVMRNLQHLCSKPIRFRELRNMSTLIPKIQTTKSEVKSPIFRKSNVFHSRHTMSSAPFNFEIKVAKTGDRDEILQFLRKFFFKDEPLNAYLGIVSDEKPINEALESYCMQSYDNDATLLGFDNGKLIAVCLNEISVKGEEHTSEYTDDKFSKIAKLLDHVHEDANLFGRFPGSKKSISVSIVSVDDSYRGKGIAKKLMDKTREIGKEKGCDFIYVVCSSHFSALAVARLGFELIYSLDFSDYKVDGKVVFKPEPPHKAITVYVKKID